MGHADFTLSRDSIEATDDMGALCDTMTQAVRSAQRAYDDRTDDRLDALYAGDARRLIAKGAARARAEDAMRDALFGQVPTASLASTEGKHAPATLVSTLLGADDAEINGLMLDALRLACADAPDHTRTQRDAAACIALRKLGDLLRQRFGAEHFSAYLGGAK